MIIARGSDTVRTAFTLIELVVVIVVLAILSGIAIPKYLDYSARARESSLRGALGGIRSAIANFYWSSASQSDPTYPTVAQLETVGVVLQEMIPVNPYNNDRTVGAVTWNAVPPVSGTAGWNYDPALGRFWANSNTVGENAW